MNNVMNNVKPDREHFHDASIEELVHAARSVASDARLIADSSHVQPDLAPLVEKLARIVEAQLQNDMI